MSPLLYGKRLQATSRLHLAVLLALAALLEGCAGPLFGSGEVQVKYVPTAKPFCAAVTRVCIRDKDQLEDPTAKEILGNNRGLDELSKKRLCPPQPECKPPKPTS